MGARIVESPIPYADRQGQSKLNVLADGLRFLSVILGIIFAYFPLRFFGPLGAFFLLAALASGLGPVSYYLEHRELLLPDMTYRLLTVVTLSVCGLLSAAFGLLAQRLSDIALGREPGRMLEHGLAVASQEHDAAELAPAGAVVEPCGERGQLDGHQRRGDDRPDDQAAGRRSQM
jgi:hypothetical protein